MPIDIPLKSHYTTIFQAMLLEVPFVSKTLNVNFIELATRVMLKQDVKPSPVYLYDFEFVACKAKLTACFHQDYVVRKLYTWVPTVGCIFMRFGFSWVVLGCTYYSLWILQLVLGAWHVASIAGFGSRPSYPSVRMKIGMFFFLIHPPKISKLCFLTLTHP